MKTWTQHQHHTDKEHKPWPGCLKTNLTNTMAGLFKTQPTTTLAGLHIIITTNRLTPWPGCNKQRNNIVPGQNITQIMLQSKWNQTHG